MRRPSPSAAGVQQGPADRWPALCRSRHPGAALTPLTAGTTLTPCPPLPRLPPSPPLPPFAPLSRALRERGLGVRGTKAGEGVRGEEALRQRDGVARERCGHGGEGSPQARG